MTNISLTKGERAQLGSMTRLLSALTAAAMPAPVVLVCKGEDRPGI